MKKFNLIALLALCSAAHETSISAMPVTKIATIICYGIVAVPVVIEGTQQLIVKSYATKQYKNALKLAHKTCNPDQIKIIEAEIEKIDQINCRTCLLFEAAKLHAIKKTDSDGAKMVIATITGKCCVKTIEGFSFFSSMPKTCKNCSIQTEKRLA